MPRQGRVDNTDALCHGPSWFVIFASTFSPSFASLLRKGTTWSDPPRFHPPLFRCQRSPAGTAQSRLLLAGNDARAQDQLGRLSPAPPSPSRSIIGFTSTSCTSPARTATGPRRSSRYANYPPVEVCWGCHKNISASRTRRLRASASITSRASSRYPGCGSTISPTMCISSTRRTSVPRMSPAPPATATSAVCTSCTSPLK